MRDSESSLKRGDRERETVYSDRSRIIGESIVRRILVAVFVEIADDEIRLISARRATRHERRSYEQGQGEEAA